MAPTYWMISNRKREGSELGSSLGKRTYWISDGGPIDRLSSWNPVANGNVFKRQVLEATTGFPKILDAERHEEQKHVTLFVHGYNTPWNKAALRYEKICESLYSGPDSLGLCILFSWPSDGAPSNYLPDRADARAAAEDLATVLVTVFEHLQRMQLVAATNPAEACYVKFSVVGHSMGNYLLQKAMRIVWTRKNQPLLVSLVNQMLMVAADVDNDLFGSGEEQQGTDGDAISNLTYRITALYSGRDQILGVSAGLKHFGKRRLGRSGLDRRYELPDNVWDIDCSGLIPKAAKNVHSAYFETSKTYDLMRDLLRGVDRSVLREARSLST